MWCRESTKGGNSDISILPGPVSGGSGGCQAGICYNLLYAFKGALRAPVPLATVPG